MKNTPIILALTLLFTGVRATAQSSAIQQSFMVPDTAAMTYDGLGNDFSPYVVQFDILNATGARFTSKMVQLQLAPCEVLGIVQDKNNTNAKPGNKQFVRIGYWIKPGETIRTSAVIIVPLNELPNVKATMYPNMNAKIPANALVH